MLVGTGFPQANFHSKAWIVRLVPSPAKSSPQHGKFTSFVFEKSTQVRIPSFACQYSLQVKVVIGETWGWLSPQLSCVMGFPTAPVHSVRSRRAFCTLPVLSRRILRKCVMSPRSSLPRVCLYPNSNEAIRSYTALSWLLFKRIFLSCGSAGQIMEPSRGATSQRSYSFSALNT